MVETLDLQGEIESLGATNLLVPEEPNKEVKETVPEKNIDKQQKTMDSTPINDIMGSTEIMNGEPIMLPPQQMVQVPAPQPVAAPTPAPAPTKSKNPMNLTDEQMEALIVGLVSIVAFSRPAQEKLADFIPNFSNEGGRTMTGVVVTGLIAAVLFYFVRRFILKSQ